MKKYIYITGMLILCVLLAASFFKVNHLPGANPLILAGLGGIALIFLPLGYFRLLKSTDDKLLRFVYSAAFISFLIDFVGAAFKILHWPGAGILLIIGVPLPFVLFLPAYIKYHNKRKLKADIHFFTIVLFMVYLGVFSSLLAIDASRNVVDAYAHAANNLTETNDFLEKNTSISPKAKELIQQLENIKQELVTYSNEKSRQAHTFENQIDYKNIPRKNIRIQHKDLKKAGLDNFNENFEKYHQQLYKTENNQRLLKEINLYRLSESPKSTPIVEQLPLIGILNVLTDWQNKILLIEYSKTL
jgi:hypothetical protein